MPTEAERVFVSLTVGEISLVDLPANEKEIIIAKSKEKPDMASEAVATTTELEAETNEDVTAEVIPIEVEAEASDAVVDALKALVGNVAALAVTKAKGGKAAGKGGKAADDKPAFLKSLEEKFKAKGLKGKAFTAAMEAAKAAFGASGLAADQPTTKAAETESTDEPIAAADVDETVIRTLEAISKAKAFTPTRIAKLIALTANLNDLLTDLGIDKASFGASGIVATATSATPSPALMDMSSSGGAGKPANTIAKSADAEEILKVLTAALEPITKSVTDLGGRIETIEKTRNPSTQPGNEETETAAVTKKTTGLWQGIL